MNSDRKYLGMTIPQLGVLAGLAGALFLILCVGGWLILGGGLNTASPQQIPTAIESTATLAAPPTATFTPAPTAIPYEQLIPQGWKQQRTDLVEIWVPSDYRETTIKDLVILDDQLTLELSLARTLTKKTLYNLYVVIGYEPLRGDSLESHFELSPTLPPSTPIVNRVVERRNVVLNGTPAVRFLLEGKSTDNLDVNTLAFVIQDGGTVWIVQYWTQINEFYDNLETFEKSILTFRPLK